MSSTADKGQDKEASRRDFLFITAGATSLVGAGMAVWPFINSMNPAKDTLALASTEVDLSPIEEGQRITVMWRKKPVFIDHRTKDQIDNARNVELSELKDPELDKERVQKPEWLVLVGICTHLGCIPKGQRTGDQLGEYKGWFCPCHGSHYDTSGRIRKGPAPTNLPVPPYKFTNETTILIG